MHENDSDLQILLFLRPSGLNIKQRQLQLCTSSDSQPSPTYLRVKQALIREFGRTQFDTVRNVTVAALADRQGVNPTLSGQVHSITGLGHETDSEKLKLLARSHLSPKHNHYHHHRCHTLPNFLFPPQLQV